MELTPQIESLIVGPVMIVIGTDCASGWPTIGRALGARMVDSHRLDLVYSASRHPDIARDLAAYERIAVTIARVTDYSSCQIKGRATSHAAEAADDALAHAYRRRLTDFFVTAGTSLAAIDEWIGGTDLRCVRIAVTEVYDQTPGPQAGTAIGRPERP